MVEVNQEKIDKYVSDMRTKLDSLKTDEERTAYKDYCYNECKKWDLDVNYHKAYEVVFGEKFFVTPVESEDVPF